MNKYQDALNKLDEIILTLSEEQLEKLKKDLEIIEEKDLSQKVSNSN